MLRLVIWWIFFGIMTFVLVPCALTLVSCNRYDDEDIEHRVAQLWLSSWSEGMWIKVGSKRLSKIVSDLFSIVACVAVWPFDRILMYVHWREACKQVESELKERS